MYKLLGNKRIIYLFQLFICSRRHLEAKEWPWYKVWGGKFEGLLVCAISFSFNLAALLFVSFAVIYS
jgi:hypothetical protein